jgi:hypothetical protein
MTIGLIAISGSLATAPSVLAVLVACSLLLSLRAWSGTAGVIRPRQFTLLLDGIIAFGFAFFLFLVIVRFETLG